MDRWLCTFLVIFLLTIGQANAAEPVGKGEPGRPPSAGQQCKKQGVVINADESELTITGWHGAGSYSGSVRLTARGAGVLKVLFLPSDLRRDKDGKTIDRQVITADNEIQLTPDTPKNIKVTVNGVEEPGIYLGQVRFLPPAGAQGKTLPLKVIVKSPQPLIPLPGTDQLKIHLSSPGWLSRLLLPAAETMNQRVLQFKNPFQLPVSMGLLRRLMPSRG